MQMFGVKPCTVINMRKDGTIDVSMGSSEPIDGVTDPSQLPKTPIMRPGLGQNVPKNQWREATQGIVRATAIPDFYATFGIEKPK